MKLETQILVSLLVGFALTIAFGVIGYIINPRPTINEMIIQYVLSATAIYLVVRDKYKEEY